MRVLSRLAVLAACALALGGCHEILLVTLGKPDPPVHNPAPAGKKRAVVAGGSPGAMSFRGRADGELAGRLVLRHGFVKSRMRNALFRGTFRATTSTPGASLGPLADASWFGRFTAVLDRRDKTIRLKGLLLASFTDADAGRACLRIGYRNVKQKGKRRAVRRRGLATVTVVGGEGGAKTLGGSTRASIRVRKDGTIRMRGTVAPREVPARGLNAACAKLRSQAGLAPL